MITMLLSLPRWVYAVIAALLIVIGAYLYGHHKGWYERDAEMQAEIAKKNEESRAIEKKLGEQINQNATKLQEANNAINQKQSALDRAIRAGRVRFPASGCVQATANPAPAAGDRNETRAQSDRAADKAADAAGGPSEAERETLAAIAAIVAEGDRHAAQLNACIDSYNTLRDRMNDKP